MATDRPWRLFLLLLGLALAGLGRSAPVDMTHSDPRGTLLASQALIENGSIRLDGLLPPAEAVDNFRFLRHGEHLYYYFPLGTPLYMAPLVGLARLAGADMADPDTERTWQRWFAAAVVCLSFWAAYALARRRVGRWPALLLALAFAAGSSFASTAPVALWSLDLATLAILLGALAVTAGRPGPPPVPAVIGAAAALFAAYLCRPTFALPVALLTLYALVRSPRRGLLLVGLILVQLAALVLFSWREFGQLLPPYYLPERLYTYRPFGRVLKWQLLSPSRGALIYNPLLAVVLAGMVLAWRRVRRDPLAWVGLLWIAGHSVTIARFHHWWGGHGYGSRLFADAVPGILLLGAAVWAAAEARSASYRVGRFLAPAAIALGIGLNGGIGLFNIHSARWNGIPDVGLVPGTLLDWRFPQFLASPAQLVAKQDAYLARLATRQEADLVPMLEELPPGVRIEPDDARHLVAPQWYGIEEGAKSRWRWSWGHRVRLWFRLPRPPDGGPSRWRVTLGLGAEGTQRVLPTVFGRREADLVVSGFEPEEVSWVLSAPLPAGGGGEADSGLRWVDLQLPDATSTDGVRTIGVALFWVRVEAEEGGPGESSTAGGARTPGLDHLPVER